jgi:hypothetical protein
MTAILLLVVAVIYVGVSLSYYMDGNVGMAVAFFAYATSNVGLYFGAK